MSTTTASFLQTIQSLSERLNACTGTISAADYTPTSLTQMTRDQRSTLNMRLESDKLACHHLRTAYLDASALLGTLSTREAGAPIQQFKEQLLDDLMVLDDQLITLTMLISMLSRVSSQENSTKVDSDDFVHHPTQELQHAT